MVSHRHPPVKSGINWFEWLCYHWSRSHMDLWHKYYLQTVQDGPQKKNPLLKAHHDSILSHLHFIKADQTTLSLSGRLLHLLASQSADPVWWRTAVRDVFMMENKRPFLMRHLLFLTAVLYESHICICFHRYTFRGHHLVFILREKSPKLMTYAVRGAFEWPHLLNVSDGSEVCDSLPMKTWWWTCVVGQQVKWGYLPRRECSPFWPVPCTQIPSCSAWGGCPSRTLNTVECTPSLPGSAYCEEARGGGGTLSWPIHFLFLSHQYFCNNELKATYYYAHKPQVSISSFNDMQDTTG